MFYHFGEIEWLESYLWKHGVLVFYGCHNKILWTEWLNQQNCIFSQLWRLKVHDQCIGMVVSSAFSLPDLQVTIFLLCSSQGHCSVHVHPYCLCVSKYPLLISTPLRLDDGLPKWPHLTLISPCLQLMLHSESQGFGPWMYDFWASTVQSITPGRRNFTY